MNAEPSIRVSDPEIDMNRTFGPRLRLKRSRVVAVALRRRLIGSLTDAVESIAIYKCS